MKTENLQGPVQVGSSWRGLASEAVGVGSLTEPERVCFLELVWIGSSGRNCVCQVEVPCMEETERLQSVVPVLVGSSCGSPLWEVAEAPCLTVPETMNPLVPEGLHLSRKFLAFHVLESLRLKEAKAEFRMFYRGQWKATPKQALRRPLQAYIELSSSKRSRDQVQRGARCEIWQMI